MKGQKTEAGYGEGKRSNSITSADAYVVVALGFEDSACTFLQYMRESPWVQNVIDCGLDKEMAECLLRVDRLFVFAVGSALSIGQVLSFLWALPPCWRRGVLIRERSTALALGALRSRQVADYILPPVNAERLEEMFNLLRFWEKQWKSS